MIAESEEEGDEEEGVFLLIEQQLVLICPGTPKALARHRYKIGKGKKTMNSYNPSKDDQQAFINSVQGQLPNIPWTGPISIQINFFFPRPRDHYKKVGGVYTSSLKKSAPMQYTRRPDIDNLAKFVLDALNKLAFEDDAQVVHLSATKQFADERGARTEVIVTKKEA